MLPECLRILHRLLVYLQSGSLAFTSITFAAVIWDADEPCSEETAWAPESSFTMSPRSTPLSFVLLNFWFELRIFEMTDVHQCSKVDLFFRLFVLPEKPPLLLTFSICHAGIVSSFFHALSTASFYIPNVHRLRHKNKLVNQIVMEFMRFHFATMNGLSNLLGCKYLRTHFRVASPSFLFAQHGCCHRSCQLSHRKLESFFVIFVI